MHSEASSTSCRRKRSTALLKDLAAKTHRGLRCRVEQFASGVGPRAITKALNAKAIVGPDGSLWNDTTIRGHVKRGTGIINNELYVGRLVWNNDTSRPQHRPAGLSHEPGIGMDRHRGAGTSDHR